MHIKSIFLKTGIAGSIVIFLLSVLGVFAFAYAQICTCAIGNYAAGGANGVCVIPTPVNCSSQGCTCPAPFVTTNGVTCEAPPINCLGTGHTKSCTCAAGFEPNSANSACVIGPPQCGGSTVINTPFNGPISSSFVTTLFQNVANIFFFVVGLVLLALIIYAGYLYLFDAGNEESAKKAKKVLTYAVIGVAIIAFTGVILKVIETIFGISL